MHVVFLLFKLASKIKRRMLKYFGKNSLTAKDLTLISIRKQVYKRVKNCKKDYRQKIMYGPSFSLYEPTQIHDFLITQALILRGAKIIPVGMGNLEEGESIFWGGVWGKYKDGEEKYNEIKRRQFYKNFFACEKKLWKIWSSLEQVLLSKYLNQNDRETIRKIALGFDDEYKNWVYKQMPVGRWALDILRNNYMVGDEKLIKSYKSKLKKLLYNIILNIHALEKTIDEIKPDIIVSNDSFYYPWSILEFLAKKKSIPFYSYWTPVGRNGTCAYAYNSPAMALDLSELWKKWEKCNLSKDQKFFVDKALKNRKSMMIFNTDNSLKDNKINKFGDLGLDFNKKIVLLVSNIVWDLAALDKEIQFRSMFEWISEVVNFFEKNQQWQLIIKSHPVEENRHIPLTEQRVCDFIKSRHKKLSSNIILLDAKTKYSVYDLFDFIDVGLSFTSTAGLEMACEGIPVLTSGRASYHDKGFTYDTENNEKYFKALEHLLKDDLSDNKKKSISEQARKFFLLQHFCYYMQPDFFDYIVGDKKGVVLRVNKMEDLLPGENIGLDYICDSILNHLSIVSKERHPPLRLN